MRHACTTFASLGIASAILFGCAQGSEQASQGTFAPQYNGIETILLDGDLVNFRVAMTGARNNADVEAYARCAAAQYALIRGAGFARRSGGVTPPHPRGIFAQRKRAQVRV